MIFRRSFGKTGFGAQEVFDFLARNFDAAVDGTVLKLTDDDFLAQRFAG